MKASAVTAASARAKLDYLFYPRSIAVVGATETPGTFAANVMVNLKDKFAGRLLPINPRRQTVFGLPCYPSLDELPAGEIPDAAMILVDADAAVDVLRDCRRLGVKSATVFGAGFGEAQAGGDHRVGEVKAILQDGGFRLCGPNTIGLANYIQNAVMIAALNVPPSLRAGSVGIISQSGGMGYTLLNKAFARDMPVGLMVAAGNSLDISLAEYLDYYADKDELSTILLYFEAVPDLRELTSSISRAVQKGKVVAALRGGRTEAGSKMALSHTGVMTESSTLVDELLTSVGAIMHDSLEDMFETAYAATMVGPLTGRGIGIVSTSGGCNVLGADKAIEHGLEVATLSDDTVGFLAKTYPFATAHNPYDPTGLWRRKPEALKSCIARIANDPAVALTAYVYASNHAENSKGIVEANIDAAKEASKPVVAAYFSAGPLSLPFEQRLRVNGVPVFQSLDACFGALARLASHAQAVHWTSPKKTPENLPLRRTARVRELLGSARQTTLDEAISKKVLGCYAIPVVSEAIVSSFDDAAAWAQSAGYPVVLKKFKPGLIHKTESDGIRLNLSSVQMLRTAFDELTRDGEEQALIQSQITGGTEIILGGRRDPALGPIVIVGMGGIFTELLHDRSVRMAPVSTSDAHAMLQELRSQKLLDGFRGGPPLNRDAIVEAIVRLSWLLAEHPEIDEIDLNPMIATASAATAVDATIILKPVPS